MRRREKSVGDSALLKSWVFKIPGEGKGELAGSRRVGTFGDFGRPLGPSILDDLPKKVRAREGRLSERRSLRLSKRWRVGRNSGHTYILHNIVVNEGLEDCPTS